MGYRSDVAIAFYTTKDEQIEFVKIWVKEKMPKNEWFVDSLTEFRTGYLFEVEDVKWYDTYGHIQDVNTFVELFVNTFCGGDEDDPDEYGVCEFVRVGEEFTDIEVETYGHYCQYLLSVCRHIDTENVVGFLGAKS